MKNSIVGEDNWNYVFPKGQMAYQECKVQENKIENLKAVSSSKFKRKTYIPKE